MSRDENVRQAVLERDGRRCQLCGKDENLNTHHIQPLGMGGSEERDVAENMLTLCTECHGKVHVGILHIEEFTLDTLIITDSESRRVPDDQLWFYQRQQAEHLEQVEARIQGLSAIEGAVAKDLWELSEGYPLIDPDAVSFAQYTAGRGWSASRATMAARAFSWVKKHGLAWPVGLTAEKVNIIRLTDPEDGQPWLDGAVDQSLSDLRRLLVEKGLKLAVSRWYLVIGQYRRPLGRIQTDVLFVRSRDREAVLRRAGPGVKVVEINCFRKGIKWDRKRRALLDGEGRDVPFEEWEDEV